MKYGATSKRKDDNLIVPLWLTFDARGNVRLTRNEPDVSRNERAMQMTVTVPLALFRTPTISATMTIAAPEMAVPQIDVIAAADALKSALGCDVDVRIASGIEARSDATPKSGAAEGESPVGEAETPNAGSPSSPLNTNEGE